MRIDAIGIMPVEMPLHDKDWAFALATVSSARGYAIRLSAGGMHGYGYAPAIPHMGSTFEGLPVEFARFAPLLKNFDPRDMEGLLLKLERSLHGAPQAKAAIECAAHDLVARAFGTPLWGLLGGKRTERVPVIRILALKPPDEMATKAEELFREGYQYFKIKVHGDINEDVARVKAIRERIGEDAHLTIDANQSYSPKEAILAIERMARYRVDLFEQPVHRFDLKGLALVTRESPALIEADEAAGTLEEIAIIVKDRLADAVSLKIPKLGGLRNARAAARLCAAYGIKYRVGAHVGTRLLNAHGLHLAVSCPEIDYACELGEFARMDGDPFTGLEVQNGHVELPKDNGCGVQPIHDVWQTI